MMGDYLHKQNTEDTFWARIYIAGSRKTAEEVCREFCYYEGLCVNVMETNYIYTAGEQSGVVVELINYPRFPTIENDIKDTAERLAEKLVARMYQKSLTIMYEDETVYYTTDKAGSNE